MQVENAPAAKVCTSCGRTNANSLKFCLTCGQQFSADSVLVYGPDRSSPTFCKGCGIDDPLNEKYCIACGNIMQAPVTFVQQADVVKKEVGNQLRSSLARSSPSTALIRKETSTVTLALLFSVLVLGTICGIGGAIAVNDSRLLSYALNRIFWPRSGLVVYVKPPNSLATLSTLDSRKRFLAKADRHGNLSISTLTDGEYRLTLKAPGCKTLAQIVKIDANKPTILGYPDPLTLPNDSPDMP
jgi:hypothetical protein